MKIDKSKLFITTTALFSLGLSIAAPGPPAPAAPGPGPPGPPGLPIDNGVFILFAVAVVYGIYAVNRYKKRLS